jgi:aspartate 1-decarboxylase
MIICTYAEMTGAEADEFKPVLVYADDENKIARISNAIPMQVS